MPTYTKRKARLKQPFNRLGETPERLEIIWLAQGGDANAVAELAGLYRALIRFFARKFANSRIEADDLYQEGWLIFMQVIGRYQSRTGARFISYLAAALKWRLRELANAAGVIKCPARFNPDRMLPTLIPWDDIQWREEPSDQSGEIWLDCVGVEEIREAQAAIRNTPLTCRERQVITYWLAGLDSRQITTHLGVSRQRVATLRAVAVKKIRSYIKCNHLDAAFPMD